MTIVLNLDDFSRQGLHVLPSPLAEMMALLHALAEPDHHRELRTVLENVAEHINEGFHQEFRALSPLWARFRCRLLFPLAAVPLSFDDELRAIGHVPLAEFVELFAEGVQGQDIEVAPIGDIFGDAHDRSAFLNYCRSRSFERYDLGVALVDDPEGTRARLLHFLSAANELFFRREWRVVQEDILRATEKYGHDAVSLEPAEALSRLHYSARYLPDTNEVRFDKLQRVTVSLAGRTVVAVPSVRVGTHLTIKRHQGLPVIIHFPIGSTGADELSIEAMRQRLAALNSSSRMELFRHLAGESITTSELAARMQQNVAQVSRELRVLRSADMLISERRGKHVYHRINMQKVISLGSDLISILLR